MTVVLSVKSQQIVVEKGLAYVKIGQKIRMHVGDQNGGGKPKRILVGTWYRITCGNMFVSIPILKKDSEQEEADDMRKPIRYAEYHSSEQRVAPCDEWFGVAYSYGVENKGQPENNPFTLFQLGNFAERKNQPIAYHLDKLNVSNWETVLHTNRTFIQYNPFYFVTSEDDPDNLADTVFDIFIGPVNPLPLLHLNLFKYYTYPASIIINNTIVTDMNKTNHTTPRGLQLLHNGQYLFPGIVSIPNYNRSTMIKPCIDVRLQFNIGVYVKSTQKAEIKIELRKESSDSIIELKWELDFNRNKTKLRFIYQGQEKAFSDERIYIKNDPSSYEQKVTLELRYCLFPKYFTAYYQYYSRYEYKNSDKYGFAAEIKDHPTLASYNQGEPLDLKITFTNTDTNNNNFYLTRIRIHEGGIYAENSWYVSSTFASSSGCLHSSLTLNEGFALSAYCLVCHDDYVWEAGTCTQVNTGSSASGFNSTGRSE